MGRSPCCAKVGLNKGAWTSAEDKILTDFIHLNGEGRWRNLPKRAGLKRCGKSCRLRWLNYLRPDIKRGNISDDEEDLIIRLHKLLGNRWSLIAGRLPGRTDNEIKNYWNTTLRKKSHDHHTSSISVPKTRRQNKRKVKKKVVRSEPTQPNDNVDSDLSHNNNVSKSTESQSDHKAMTNIVTVRAAEESPMLKENDLSLEMELNSELLSSDYSGLFKSTSSSGSYERPLMEMLEEFWGAAGDNNEPDLFTPTTTTDHCFPSLSDCVGDWLL